MKQFLIIMGIVLGLASCVSTNTISYEQHGTSIPEYAFTGYAESTTTIPDSVTTIGKAAYSGCRYLSSITIPVSVTRIDQWAFYGCQALATIYYEGSMQQWKRIQKGEDWSKGVKHCVIECNDGDIVLNWKIGL
jgi:hypothetical protein